VCICGRLFHRPSFLGRIAGQVTTSCNDDSGRTGTGSSAGSLQLRIRKYQVVLCADPHHCSSCGPRDTKPNLTTPANQDGAATGVVEWEDELLLEELSEDGSNAAEDSGNELVVNLLGSQYY